MIRLALRLQVRRGTAGLWSALLVAAGVTLGCAMLLGAAALAPAVARRDARIQWRQPEYWLQGGAPVARMHVADEYFRDQRIVVVRFSAEPGGAFTLPGAPRNLAPGETALSPALERLAGAAPPEELSGRFARPVGSIAESALAWPGELVAYESVAASQLSKDAVAVSGFDGSVRPRAVDPFTWLVVVFGVGVVVLQIVVFIVSALRIDTVAREQRLAVLRLCGATRGDVSVIVSVETSLLVGLGIALAPLAFLALRRVATLVPVLGMPLSQRDLVLDPRAYALVAVGLLVLGVATARWAMQRVDVSPLGVAHSEPSPTLSPWRAVPLVVSLALLAPALGALHAFGSDGSQTGLALAAVCFAGVVLGLVFAGPLITQSSGAWLAVRARTAPVLLAARRLASDPRSGYRAVGGAVLAMFVASMFYTIQAGVDANPLLSGLKPAGVVVLADASTDKSSLAEKIRAVPGVQAVTRASRLEIPSGTGKLAVVWLAEQGDVSRVIDVPSFSAGAVAMGSGLDPGRAYVALGGTHVRIPRDSTAYRDSGLLVPDAVVTTASAIAQPDRLLVATDGSAATLDRVRTASSLAGISEAGVFSATTRSATGGTGHRGLSLVVDLGVLATLLIAGLSLAVTASAGMLERRLPFSLLRMSGVTLGELRTVVMLESALPLVLASVLSMATGAVVGQLLLRFGSELENTTLPGVGTWVRLSASLMLALALVAATLPLLARVTDQEQTRFE